MLSVPCPVLTPAVSGSVDSSLGSRQEKSSRNGNGSSQDPLHPLFTSCPCSLPKSEVLSLFSLIKSGRNEHCGSHVPSRQVIRMRRPGRLTLVFLFIFLKVILFIYFWLRGLFSGCSVWAASLCSGFSRCGAQALGHVGFGSCGSRAPLLCGVWDHPRSETEPHWQADSLFLWNNQGCFPIRETPSAVQREADGN